MATPGSVPSCVNRLHQVVAKLNLPSGQELHGEGASRAMDAYMREVEALMAEACSRYGRRYMLVAIQTFLPKWLLAPQEGFEGDMQEIFNRAAVAAYKHCRPDHQAECKRRWESAVGGGREVRHRLHM